MQTNRYETEELSFARGYLITSAASAFAIMFYHAKLEKSKIAGGWISLLFQCLIVYIFNWNISFARMNNFDIIHGLALGYYIASSLFPHSLVSIVHHIVCIVGLVANAYFVATENIHSGPINLPIITICMFKTGDLLADVMHLLIYYKAPTDIINLSMIFELVVFVYTHFYLPYRFWSKYSKIYTILGLIMLGLSLLWTVGQLLSLRKRLFIFTH